MGMEVRGGRKNYYYRKVRVGSRVMSIYAGSGSMAILSEMQETIKRAKKRQARKVAKAFRDHLTNADTDLATFCNDLDRQVEEIAKTLGIYLRRGNWRRRTEKQHGGKHEAK